VERYHVLDNNNKKRAASKDIDGPCHHHGPHDGAIAETKKGKELGGRITTDSIIFQRNGDRFSTTYPH